jgi:hypothetical protein
MKNIFILLLSCLFVCSCSPRRASDLVVAGKDIKWIDNYGYTAVTNVMHIAKRDGLSIEGVRLVTTDGTGAIKTNTADRGTLNTNFVSTVCGSTDYTNAVLITLEDAQWQSTTTNQTIKNFSFYYHP